MYLFVTQQWNLHNVYLSNLHDIRTSIRLQKKKELRQEKKLEQLREEQLLLSQRRSHSRTKRYNQKARQKLISNGTKTAVLQSEHLEKNLQHLVKDFKDQVSTMVSADDNIAINIDSDKAMVSMDDSRLQLHIPLDSSISPPSTSHMYLQPQVFPSSRRRKRPKMIIVDKTQRRPPSRLVHDEYAQNREHELVHENLEGYDYLVQEYFLDPDSDTMYMVINTYLDQDTYKATVCPIDCELQHIPLLQSPEFKSLHIIGENGIIDLVNKFYNMVTANGLWPSSNEAWLEAQRNDDSWLTILTKLEQPNTCIILKRAENYMDYVTREPLDDNTLGPLIRYISVPKHLSHSHLMLSYREEFRQMMVPDNLILLCVDITLLALCHPVILRM